MTTASQDLDEECIHERTRRFCSLCNGTVERFRREHDLEVERVLKMRGWRISNYDGRCAKCGEKYKSGSPIAHISALNITSETGNWVGMCCAPEDK